MKLKKFRCAESNPGTFNRGIVLTPGSILVLKTEFFKFSFLWCINFYSHCSNTRLIR